MSARTSDQQPGAPVCLSPGAGSISSSYTAVVLDPTFDTNATPVGPANLNEQGHVAFGGLEVPGTSPGQARFYDGISVRSLGTLGGSDSNVAGLNSADQVTGSSTTAEGAQHAFLWTPANGMLDLGAPAGKISRGQAINEQGHISGMIIDGIRDLPFLWTPQAGIVTAQESSTVFAFTTASLINASDAIAGLASTPQSVDEKQAYLWTAGNGVLAVGSLGGRSSFPQDLNDANQVVGSAQVMIPVDPFRSDHAFLWTAEAGTVDLGTFGGNGSNALAINQPGQIVGAAQDANGFSRAFLWSPSSMVIMDLGTLGGAAALARDINDSGVVVGVAQTANGSQHAFIWTSTDGMVDLNTRVTAAPAGLELRFAVAISNSGFVLALSNQGLVLLKPDCATGAGSVTGTVRFQSPAGALASNPALAARASLNSVVRNTSDPAQPAGHTVLRMNEFVFRAIAYDQLLVEDGRAQYQGQGTLNGAGGYFFRITEIDSGEPGGRGDAVQIRIWHLDADTQSEVIDYDTGATAVETDSGNIVVHLQ